MTRAWRLDIGQVRPRWSSFGILGDKERAMQGENVRIRSGKSGEVDCYIATPSSSAKVPAVVLASAVHGVNEDLRDIADEFAVLGYIAAAPDLFWRTVP